MESLLEWNYVIELCIEYIRVTKICIGYVWIRDSGLMIELGSINFNERIE